MGKKVPSPMRPDRAQIVGVLYAFCKVMYLLYAIRT